jgi:hypothetical protein
MDAKICAEIAPAIPNDKSSIPNLEIKISPIIPNYRHFSEVLGVHLFFGIMGLLKNGKPPQFRMISPTIPNLEIKISPIIPNSRHFSEVP